MFSEEKEPEQRRYTAYAAQTNPMQDGRKFSSLYFSLAVQILVLISDIKTTAHASFERPVGFYLLFFSFLEGRNAQ